MHHRFRRNERGVSTVFGMVFFLLIVVIVFASFFTVLNQNILLEDSMVQLRQIDNDRAKEIMVLKTVAKNGNDFTFRINNTGTLSAQVVRLWVEDSTGKTGSWSVPGDQQVFLPNEEANCGIATISGLNNDLRYSFVTARGNQFTYGVTGPQGPQGSPGADGTDGINGTSGSTGETYVGPFILIFSRDSFMFTADNSPPTPNNPAGSMPDISVPSTAYKIDNDNQRVTFHVQIGVGGTRNVEISQQSFFLVEVRELSGGNPGTTEYERYFHVVRSSSTYNNLQTYTPDFGQVLPAGQVSTLKFAAQSVGGTSFLNPEGEYQPLQGDGDNGNTNENLCWTFLVLYWRYEGSTDEFGTTITYFAIRTSP